MKKLLVLALVALVAGAAFAETAPAFSGSFEFYTTFDLTEDPISPQVGSSEDAKINLNGVVDEWSTVNAEIGHSNVKTPVVITGVEKGRTDGVLNGLATIEINDKIKTTNGDVDVKAGNAFIGQLPAAIIGTAYDSETFETDTLTLNQFTMTTDLTGALGVDGPVGITVQWGALTLDPAEYQGVAGYGDISAANGSSTEVGLKLTVALMDKINIITAVFPKTYVGSATETGFQTGVFGIELQLVGLVEGLNANFFYTLDPTKDMKDGEAGTQPLNELGVTAGYSMDAISAGLAFRYDLDKGVAGAGISAVYKMDILSVGLAFVAKDFENFASDNTSIGLNATFKAVPDVLDVTLAVSAPLGNTSGWEDLPAGSLSVATESYDLGVEAAVKAYLGGVTYILGYEHNQVNFASPNGDDSTGVFFYVKASF